MKLFPQLLLTFITTIDPIVGGSVDNPPAANSMENPFSATQAQDEQWPQAVTNAEAFIKGCGKPLPESGRGGSLDVEPSSIVIAETDRVIVITRVD
jgi:hypothetical protein